MNRLAKIGATALDPIEWRSLEWLPRYEVSEFGDLRRTVAVRGYEAGSVLKGHVNPAGYRNFHVYLEGKRLPLLAHRLVCEAWHGPAPDGRRCAAHGDGDRLNNHFRNLRWASDAENMADRRAHGNYKTGEHAPHVRLTWAIVDEIRATYTGAFGEAAALSRRFGISQQHISEILKNRIWVREVA